MLGRLGSYWENFKAAVSGMVAEEIVVCLSGGAPWGFRLQGGADQQKPLQVAKVRRRSKACRAGLKELDELVAIGQQACSELSHAQAMSIIDTQSTTLNLRVKRASAGFCSTSTWTSSLSGLTSPPDSEAYYGETDSDADTHSLTHRRQRRTPPHARSPARYDNQAEEETSEMSGYESATDAGLSLQWEATPPTGVPRKELLHQPPQAKWATPSDTPHTLTPRTLTPPLDQSLIEVEAEGEGDSGFQEAGLACPPLVSPQRAKEALMLGSGKQLVPMVGPQKSPVSEELSATYMDKARQAKLHRGESQVEKQVKEARTKCRSIASLLTDAPNPNSKGVLMFKKRRQRAKKYTLTCFGKVERDEGGDTEGETEEEGGSSVLSGSELDETGFSASFDPTWDSGYLDLLDRRSSACPSAPPTAPTTPTTPNCSLGLDASAYQSLGIASPAGQSPGLLLPEPECSANHSPRLDCTVGKQPIGSHPAEMSPPAVTLTNGGPVAISRASVQLSPPSQGPLLHLNGFYPDAHRPESDLDNISSGPSSVLNRTARPFTPGPASARASVTSVMFRPPQPKAAVSAVAVPTGPDARRAVSSTSLYIPPRNGTSNGAATPPFDPTSLLSPHSPLPQPRPLSAAPLPALPQAVACLPSAPPPPLPPNQTHTSSFPMQPSSPAPPPPPPTQPCINIKGSQSTSSHNAAVANAAPPPAHVDAPVSREQRIAVPAARTGILHDARRRSSKKPMFAAVQKMDVSPNPDLMSMVQNMDGHNGSVESAGHESGPEEDWLRLGAEACNFMQAQRGPKPPPVAPKPQAAAQVPQLGGRGGQLFARRQSRMDRYVVERSPSVAAVPYSPGQTREPSPTPSLPATWKYSSNIRAPPPISYNPLLSPSCPPKAQKKPELVKSGTVGAKDKQKTKRVDVSAHQPYQLHSSLFSYGGGAQAQGPPAYHQQGMTCGPQKTAQVCEVKRFSTPPPSSGPGLLKVIAPRSATTLGEPLWRSDLASPPPPADSTHFQPQLSASSLSPPPPPAPTAPLPQLPAFSSLVTAKPAPISGAAHQDQARQQFFSAPDLSPYRGPRPASCGAPPSRVPRPRFSTSSLGLQPSVWRPGSVMQ